MRLWRGRRGGGEGGEGEKCIRSGYMIVQMMKEMSARRPMVLNISYLCSGPATTSEPPKEESESISCSQCLKRFSSQGNLRVHINVVHAERKDFQCRACAKRFGTKNNMQRHVAMVHRKERPFECQFCKHKFPTRSCVKRHEHTHIKNDGIK